MVSHTFRLKPFTSLKGCGDFVCVFERDNDLLFALGDVGGHGNIEVGGLAERMRTWLNENYRLSIKELFNGLSKVEGVERFGATVFLGRVDTEQSLLHYMSIGDVKAVKIASAGIKNLSTQQGVLGFTAPSSMKEFVTNLNQNDGIVVTSDGVTSFNDALSHFSMSSVETVCGHIVSQHAKKDDDASCLVLKIEGGKSKRKALDSPMVESGVTQEKYNPIEAPNSTAAKITAKQLSLQNSSLEIAHQHSPDVIALPDENTFFCVLDSQLAARKKIRELKDYLQLSDKQRISMKSIALEAISTLGVDVNVYVSESRMSITFPYNNAFYQQVNLVIGREHVGISPCGKWLVVWVLLANNVNITSTVFDEFKERVQLGISEENYAQYQQDQKRDVVLAQQAKLASMGEMIGAIAHQWRQPLNELALRIQTLKYKVKKGITDDDINSFIKDNLVTIDFMSKTVDDFRNFFRIDKSKEVFDVAKTVESVVVLQQAQLQSNGIDLVITGATGDVEGFKSEFQQVILNLVSNARDALNAKGNSNKVIEIAFDLNKITVTDNAGGIPPDVIERIFEPYFTTKAHGEGTGMGLYMSKMIINDHMEGEITAKNVTTVKGKGAEFTIKLPFYDSPRNKLPKTTSEVRV